MAERDWERFEIVLSHVRSYFVTQYHAGTREMVYRFVVNKMQTDVPPLLVSAALRVLKDRGTILFDKRVWWFLTDK